MKYRPLAMHVCLPKYVLPRPSQRLTGPGPSGPWSSYTTALVPHQVAMPGFMPGFGFMAGFILVVYYF